jgi:hypothetical protein
MTGRNPAARVVAAVGATAVLGLAACSGADEESASSASATAQPSASEPAAEEIWANSGVPLEPGTYTYDNGPVPYTYTTSGTTLDETRGGDPYRVVLGVPYGALGFDFPVKVADLSEQVTPQESAGEELVFAGPIEIPADIGRWLADAAALRVVDQGTLSRPDGTASWWDLEVSDPAARCFVEGPPPPRPCVVLWPYLDDEGDRQLGDWVLGSARLYAVETGAEPVLATAHIRGGPQEAASDWLSTADEIVASMTVG